MSSGEDRGKDIIFIFGLSYETQESYHKRV